MLLRRCLNVRSWLGTDIRSPEIDFCSTPNTGHSVVHAGLPLLTQNGLPPYPDGYEVLVGDSDPQVGAKLAHPIHESRFQRRPFVGIERL